MQKINPITGVPLGPRPQPSKKSYPKKKVWQDWAWKISPADSKKTIELIQKNVKKQVAASLKKTKKRRKVEYEWQFRVKIYITPPATRRAGISGTSDPPDPTQPPPPSLTTTTTS